MYYDSHLHTDYAIAPTEEQERWALKWQRIGAVSVVAGWILLFVAWVVI